MVSVRYDLGCMRCEGFDPQHRRQRHTQAKALLAPEIIFGTSLDTASLKSDSNF
jgi:hypothetical protein